MKHRQHIKTLLKQHVSSSSTSGSGSGSSSSSPSSTSASNPALFFKTGAGQYAAHDKFLGINVPTLRHIAKQFPDISLEEIHTFLFSKYNEERFLALILLVNKYQRAERTVKEECYRFYIKHLKQINNWNLVDASAHLIIGAHLYTSKKNTSVLRKLAKSPNLWEKRIAIVSTWYFIRQKDVSLTFTIATLLLRDQEDLIHKAVGWMLREAGKQNMDMLLLFLDKYALTMPRTMLRYAIEKLSPLQRKHYLGMR